MFMTMATNNRKTSLVRTASTNSSSKSKTKMIINRRCRFVKNKSCTGINNADQTIDKKCRSKACQPVDGHCPRSTGNAAASNYSRAEQIIADVGGIEGVIIRSTLQIDENSKSIISPISSILHRHRPEQHQTSIARHFQLDSSSPSTQLSFTELASTATTIPTLTFPTVSLVGLSPSSLKSTSSCQSSLPTSQSVNFNHPIHKPKHYNHHSKIASSFSSSSTTKPKKELHNNRIQQNPNLDVLVENTNIDNIATTSSTNNIINNNIGVTGCGHCFAGRDLHCQNNQNLRQSNSNRHRRHRSGRLRRSRIRVIGRREIRRKFGIGHQHHQLVSVSFDNSHCYFASPLFTVVNGDNQHNSNNTDNNNGHIIAASPSPPLSASTSFSTLTSSLSSLISLTSDLSSISSLSSSWSSSHSVSPPPLPVSSSIVQLSSNAKSSPLSASLSLPSDHQNPFYPDNSPNHHHCLLNRLNHSNACQQLKQIINNGNNCFHQTKSSSILHSSSESAETASVYFPRINHHQQHLHHFADTNTDNHYRNSSRHNFVNNNRNLMTTNAMMEMQLNNSSLSKGRQLNNCRNNHQFLGDNYHKQHNNYYYNNSHQCDQFSVLSKKTESNCAKQHLHLNPKLAKAKLNKKMTTTINSSNKCRPMKSMPGNSAVGIHSSMHPTARIYRHHHHNLYRHCGNSSAHYYEDHGDIGDNRDGDNKGNDKDNVRSIHNTESSNNNSSSNSEIDPIISTTTTVTDHCGQHRRKQCRLMPSSSMFDNNDCVKQECQHHRNNNHNDIVGIVVVDEAPADIKSTKSTSIIKHDNNKKKTANNNNNSGILKLKTNRQENCTMITKRHLPNNGLSGLNKISKKSIVFAENQPEIIGYREPSDDECEDEEERLHFLRNLAGCGGNPSDKDDSDDLQKDAEWVALQELTQSNTLFNSKYSNFKLDGGSNGLLGQSRPTGLGLGKPDSGPIKFVIQDGNQQPLAPTKFSSNIAGMTKKFSNDNATATSPTKPSKPIASSRTSIEKNNVELPTQSKPVVDHLKKPVLSNAEQQPTTITNTVIDQSTANQRKFAIEKLNIDKIRIPRASILDASKSKPSMPPPSPPVAQPPTPPMIVTPTTGPKPLVNNKEKDIGPTSNIKTNQNISKTELNNISKLVTPIETQNLKPSLNDSTNTSSTEKSNESVVVVDSVDGSILTLDSKKLKNRSIHDKDTEMFLLNHHNHLRHSNNQHHDNLDTLSESSASSSSGCCSANSSSSPTPPSSSTSPTNTDSCSSPSPDSLDSTPDSYDLIKDNLHLQTDVQSQSNHPKPDNGCLEQPQRYPVVPHRSINYTTILPKPSTNLAASDEVIISSGNDKIDDNSASTEINSNNNDGNNVEPSANQPSNVQLQSMKLFANNEFQPTENHLQNNLVNNNKKSNASIFSTSSSMVGHDNINNKTTISINYRSHNSQLVESAQQQLDSGSNDPLSRNNSQNRNKMLARLAQDLQQHRSAGDSSSESSSSSSNTNIDQTTLTSSHNSLLRSNSSQSNLSSSAVSYVSANSNSASNGNLQFAHSQPKQQLTDSFRERLFREAREENEERSTEQKTLGSKLKNKFLKGKKLLKSSKSDDESNSDSDSDDSDCDIPLPDMIQDSDEEVVDYSTNSETEDDDDDGSNKHRRSDSKSSSTSSSINNNFSANSTPESANKPNSVSSLFKNVVNSNKKYTKMVRKNINKTSKFIVNTTHQLRSDTNDMVRKFKTNNDKESKFNNDPANNYYQPEPEYEEHKKSKSKFGFIKGGKNKPGKHAHKTLDENYHQLSNSMDINQHSSLTSSTSDNSTETPQLLGLKRLDSFFEPVSSVKAPNSISKSVSNGNDSTTNYNSDTNPRRSAPPIPIRNYPQMMVGNVCQMPEPDIPPQAPLRRKRLSRTNAADCSSIVNNSDKLSSVQSTQHHLNHTPTTLAQIKLQLVNELNVSAIQIDDCNSIEKYVKIENTSKNSKLYKMFQCSSSITGQQSPIFNLLISNTVWTTCYDWPVYGSCDDFVPKFNGTPCRIVSQKWNKFVSLSSFCEQLNLIDSDEIRLSLVDSFMLQLYTILERLEFSATNDSLKRNYDNGQSSKKGLRFKPRTVGDKSELLVGISYSAKSLTADNCNKITDCLLLLPTKDFDNDEDQDGQPESFSMMQAFCLQVFLIQVERLIKDKLVTVIRSFKDFNSMRERKTMHAIDIFDIANRSGDDTQSKEGSIRSWFNYRNNSKQFIEKFIDLTPTENDTNSRKRMSNYMGTTILDYLEADYASQIDNEQFAIDLMHKQSD